MRALLRDLYAPARANTDPHVATLMNKASGFFDIPEETSSSEVEEYMPSSKYNYKEVSSKIQQAKNSQSAGQAVIAAKRAVQDLKRKLVTNPKEAKELQIAITHAKRMEMVAKKKQHHLELEEMVVVTQKQDEKMDRSKEAVEDIHSAMIAAEEEKIIEQQDDIFEARQEMLSDMLAEAAEQGRELSEDALAGMIELTNEFGEDMMEQLEESMEALECMEIINPHMDQDDLEKLITKHRSSEEKDMVKADMEYLKDTISLLMPETAV